MAGWEAATAGSRPAGESEPDGPVIPPRLPPTNPVAVADVLATPAGQTREADADMSSDVMTRSRRRNRNHQATDEYLRFLIFGPIHTRAAKPSPKNTSVEGIGTARTSPGGVNGGPTGVGNEGSAIAKPAVKIVYRPVRIPIRRPDIESSFIE